MSLNTALMGSGHFESPDIKSRALRLSEYLVGDSLGAIHLPIIKSVKNAAITRPGCCRGCLKLGGMQPPRIMMMVPIP